MRLSEGFHRMPGVKTILTILLIAIAFAAVLYLRIKAARPRQLTNRDVADEMSLRAAQAVEAAAREYGLDFDFSGDSVERVEEILDRIHQRHLAKPLDDRDLTRESLCWGAYVGEVIRRIKPAHWELDSEHSGPGSLPIVYDGGDGQSFPVRWCAKRIKNGDEDNVWHKFQLFVLQDGESSGITFDPDVDGL